MVREPAPNESPWTRWGILVLSGLLLGGLAVLLQGARPGSVSATPLLPTIDALFNGVAAICLGLGFAMIRRGRRAAHRACMLAAVGASALFLLTYVVHHAQVGSVKFEGSGWVRVVYFSLLVPHVLLAAVIVPLVLLTLLRALRGRFTGHRAIARITLPLWMFVSLSGVAVYLLLYHTPR